MSIAAELQAELDDPDMKIVSVTGVKITTARNRTLYNIIPHGFPPTRYTVQKELEDEVVEFVQVRHIFCL